VTLNAVTVSLNIGSILLPVEYQNVIIMDIVIFLLCGAVAGWLAGLVMKGHGFGVLGNIVVGVLGGMLGGFLLGGRLLSGIPGSILTAMIGAVVLLFVVGLVKKA
jgi:uncharacterized membrane protein YeaQ/YmgE (transglycosylase-associated protein family)